MINERRGWRLLTGGTLLLASSLFFTPVQAQQETLAEANADADGTVEEITETGSQIGRAHV